LELCGAFSVAGLALAAGLSSGSCTGKNSTSSTASTSTSRCGIAADVVVRPSSASHAQVLAMLAAENGVAEQAQQGPHGGSLRVVVAPAEGCPADAVSVVFGSGRADGAGSVKPPQAPPQAPPQGPLQGPVVGVPEVVVVDVVDGCGLLRQGAIEEIARLAAAVRTARRQQQHDLQQHQGTQL